MPEPRVELARESLVNGLRRGAREAWDKGEDQMRRQWPVWILGLAFYGFAALALLTKAHIPTPLHLVVFLMATAVLSVTVLRIEWGIMALAVILPFARPGITVGTPKIFHISGFNVALVGVVLAYVLRYVADAQFAKLGPLVRRTRLDLNIFAFAFLLILSSLWSFGLNESPRVTLMTMLYLKEHLLYFVWFYMLVTLLRTPQELRQFAMFFAVAGLMASVTGMATRLMGGAKAMTGGTMGENLEEGAGGRVGGGWLGLGHANMFAAHLLMTMPMWFFAVSHLKHGFRRVMAEVAVVNGFLGLLFTLLAERLDRFDAWYRYRRALGQEVAAARDRVRGRFRHRCADGDPLHSRHEPGRDHSEPLRGTREFGLLRAARTSGRRRSRSSRPTR